MKRAIRLVLLLAIALAPTTAGAEGQPEPRPQGPGVMLRKFGEHLAKLDLNADQQQQVRTVIDDMMARLEEVRRAARPDDRPMEKVGQILTDGRAKLGDILTPEQQAKLRDLVQQDRAEQLKREELARRPEPAKMPEPPKSEPKKVEPKPTEPVAKKPEPKPAEPAKKPQAKSEPKMGEDMTGGAAAKVAPANRPTASLEEGAPIDIGTAAPEFTLKTTSDKTVSLSTYKNRVVVIVFGSYTCPVFRQRVASLEKLNRDMGLKATFLVVYTREAHALGEWEVERNKDENILVEQPKSDAERQQLARQTVSAMKITVPVLVDTIDNATARAYGLTPNGAVVVGRDGKIAARQKWFEPVAMRQLIDTAAAVPRPAPNP